METQVEDKFKVVTATQVNLGKQISFKFMFDGQMPREWVGHSELYGCVLLRSFGPEEFRPFDIGRSEKTPAGTKQWVISIGNNEKGQIHSSGADEDPEEEGLQEILEEAPPAILLMEAAIYPRFEAACKKAGIALQVHHFEGELSTG